MQKKKKQDIYDDSLHKLAIEVTRELENNKDGTDQQEQVEELIDAERKFRETILLYKQSTEIYKKFLQRICITNKNILSARPYFREKATTFSKKITPAIKIATHKDIGSNRESIKNAIETLKTFDINYQFIKFIRDSWLGPFPKKAEQLFQRVHRAREILISNNIPLAINRAKLFYRKTPKSHLSLMDMIGICSMGLTSGIDKFCGKYTKVFRSVLIGRMVGNLIGDYSETMLHFYPQDKRILYKAHTIRGRKGIDEVEKLSYAVNESFKEDGKNGISVPKHEVTPGELSYLMQASSAISVNQSTSISESGEYQTSNMYDLMPDESQDIETAYIQKESTDKMLSLAANLPILQRKILRLKGVKL